MGSSYLVEISRPVLGMETVRNISGALTAIHSAEEAVKTIRTSWSILRCFLFFDICYLMSSVTLIVMALTSDKENSEMILCGGAFGIFATISAMCNSLACHGLRCWRRSFLIPWLSFYLMVLGIVTTCSLQALYSQKFLVMAFPRPDQVTLDIESVVRDFLRPSWYGTGNRNSNVVSQSPAGDLPPKYEDLDLPPQYDESMSENLPSPSSLPTNQAPDTVDNQESSSQTENRRN